MARSGWITLAEYSSKFKVSVSTLRRKIKANTAEVLFEDGKYWLRDLDLQNHTPLKVIDPDPKKDAASPQKLSSKKIGPGNLTRLKGDMSSQNIFNVVEKMMDELKRAYIKVLEEKEEQVLIYKSEIADLKTLIRVLESKHAEANASSSAKAQNRPSSWLELDN